MSRFLDHRFLYVVIAGCWLIGIVLIAFELAWVAGSSFFVAGIGMGVFRQGVAEILKAFVASFYALVADVCASMRPFFRERRGYLLGLCLILLITVGMHLWFIDQPMRADEADTYISLGSRSLPLIVSNYAVPNNHVLHTVLVHGACLPWQEDTCPPQIIRLPTLIGGLLTVAATMMCTRIFFGRWAALLATALIGVSSIWIEYATNARGYTLQTLCFLLALALGAHLITKHNPRRDLAGWTLFGVLNALGFYLIPTMLYASAGLGVWLLMTIWLTKHEQSERWRLSLYLIAAGGLTIVLTLALYMPIFLVSGVEAVTSNEFVSPQSVQTTLDNLPGMVEKTAGRWHRDVPQPYRVLWLVGLVLGLVVNRRQFPAPIWLVVVMVALVGVMVQRVTPFVRVWLYTLPLYLMTIAGGLSWLMEKISTRLGQAHRLPSAMFWLVGGFLLWLVPNVIGNGSLLNSAETGVMPDGEAIATFLEDYDEPYDYVYVHYYPILAYYWDGWDPDNDIVSNTPWHDEPIDHVLIIDNHTSNRLRLDALLDKWNAAQAAPSLEEYTAPRMIAAFDQAILYRIDRLPTLAK